MASLATVYVTVLLYSFAFSPRGVYGNASSPPSSNPSENSNPALLSASNILSATRTAWNLTALSLSYLIHLPKLVYFPIKHATAAFVYVIGVLPRPLYSLLAPVYLAIKILATPVLVPVLLLYRVAVLAYPLYVFLGAAVLCGAITGFAAQRFSGAVVKDVFGFGSRPVPVSSKGRKEATRKRRVQVKAE